MIFLFKSSSNVLNSVKILQKKTFLCFKISLQFRLLKLILIYFSDENSWEPEENLENCEKSLEEFLKKQNGEDVQNASKKAEI